MKTNAPITLEELSIIEKRAEAARSGPWISWIEGRDHVSGCDVITVGPPENREDDIYLTGASSADQDFIAAARQDVPKLVAEIRRLHNIIDSGYMRKNL